MSDKTVKVTLTADTSDFEKRIRKATRLAKKLRAALDEINKPNVKLTFSASSSHYDEAIRAAATVTVPDIPAETIAQAKTDDKGQK